MIQVPASNADCDRLLESADRLFLQRFGSPWQFGAVAPGRINLIGEHTDYNEGFVLPLAVDRHTVIVARRAIGETSTFWAVDLDEMFTANLNQPPAPVAGSFANYMLGVVDQFAQLGHASPNLDLLITGNIPRGSGLSSSASVEVAMATVLEQVVGHTLPAQEKALLCQQAEHAFPGVPCGIMDMFIITMARADHAMLIDCRSADHEHIAFPQIGASLVVVQTGMPRSLAAGEYAKRRKTCEAAARKLGVPSLRNADISDIERVELSDDERCKALHVVAENARVHEAAAALRAKDYRRLGDLMFASHASLRDLFDVSTPELNAAVDFTWTMRDRNPGVWGARMTGAGFGGCAIVVCETASAIQVIAELHATFQQQFGGSPQIFTTTAAPGARALVGAHGL